MKKRLVKESVGLSWAFAITLVMDCRHANAPLRHGYASPALQIMYPSSKKKLNGLWE